MKMKRETGVKKTVPTPTSIVYKNRCLPLFDSKTNCPLVNFHCECTFFSFWLFSVSGFSPVHIAFVIVAASVRDALHTFVNLLLFGIFCLLLLLHIAVVACKRECMQVLARVWVCVCVREVFFAVPFFCCCCFDKQAKFRNSLQMSYGHEFILHLCMLQSQSLCFKYIFHIIKLQMGKNGTTATTTTLTTQQTIPTKWIRTSWNWRKSETKMENKQIEMELEKSMKSTRRKRPHQQILTNFHRENICNTFVGYLWHMDHLWLLALFVHLSTSSK